MVDTRTERGSRVPAIVAAVLLAATIALVVVVFTVIRPDKNDNSSGHRPSSSSSTDVPQGGVAPGQQRVVDAATIEVKNILTYTRATYESDYQRALSGATGALAADLTSKKDTLLKQMQDGKFDLDGAITASGF